MSDYSSSRGLLYTPPASDESEATDEADRRTAANATEILEADD